MIGSKQQLLELIRDKDDNIKIIISSVSTLKEDGSKANWVV